MKNLLGIITEFFKNKYNFDLSTSKINLKNVFFEIMKKIENDEQHATLDVIDKNKLVLKVVKEIILKEMNVEFNRDINLYRNRKNILNDINTETSRLSSNHDIEQKMKQVENSRKAEQKKELKSFDDINKPINEQSYNESEFKTKMEELELNRTHFDNKLQELFPLDDKEFIEKRNKDMSEILNKNPCEVDPKSFYQQNELLCKTDQNIVPPTYQNLAMSTVIPNKSKDDTFDNKTLEQKYILINSFDRNWIVDKHRYQYKVKFTFSTNDILRVPYYENNPTVPYTKTEKSQGIANTFGWVDKNGIAYPPYDSSKPLTDKTDIDGKPVELGFEEIEIVVDQDASMIGTFKDVYSIQIKNVTIPTEIFHMFSNSLNINNKNMDINEHNYNFNFNFPYILCNIDEFQNVYDGTDDTIRRSFCQLQYDNLIKTPNGRGYIILKPVQQEKKIFYPNTLSSLPTLNISLTKPNGELLNLSEDGLAIFNVSVHQTYYIQIVTSTYFDKDAFYRGDYVRIKNFNMYQISNTMTNDNIQMFNDFMNRKEGHVIYEIGEPNENGYYNSFHIFAPGSFDKYDGKFVVNTRLTDTLAIFNNTLIDNRFYENRNEEGRSLSDGYENGYILNMSLQNTISMTIEMYKPDSKIMKHDPI